MATRVSGAKRPGTEAAPRLVSAEELQRRSAELAEAVARRAYEIFEHRGCAPGHHEDDWLQAESELLLPVHLELAEADRYLTIRAPAPGFSACEIEFALGPRRVTIAGTRSGPDAAAGPCRFVRVVDLPGNVETENVTAAFKDGVLVLALHKARARRRRTNAAPPTSAELQSAPSR